MNQELINKYSQQIVTNSGIGEQLVNKVEFEFLEQYFFDEETLFSLLVCLIDNKLHLVALTNSRILMVEKNPLNLFQLKSYGLEQIVDLKLISDVFETKLLLIFQKHFQIKMNQISEENAKIFGSKLVENYRLWNDRF